MLEAILSNSEWIPSDETPVRGRASGWIRSREMKVVEKQVSVITMLKHKAQESNHYSIPKSVNSLSLLELVETLHLIATDTCSSVSLTS